MFSTQAINYAGRNTSLQKNGVYSKVLATFGWWAKCLTEDITGNGQDSTVKNFILSIFFFKNS